MKTIVSTHLAPKTKLPYSQAVIWNGLVFLSGQIPLDPKSGDIVSGGIAEQTERVLENLKIVLAEAGSSLGNVLKTTVFLTDMGNFAQMNEVYARHFPQDPPARSTIEAARLPRDVSVEIDCIAVVDKA